MSALENDFDDGIYFGLPDEAYHAIPRLSASGIKLLEVSPLDFWTESWMNPAREPEGETTPAKRLGKAYHKLLLEGDAAFDASYAVGPDEADYPNAIKGGKALKEKCKDLGLKQSGTIEDMCMRIHEADPVVELWPDILAEFKEIMGEREPLTKAQWREIQIVRLVLGHMPKLRGAFTGGMPEVTLLWTDPDTGVRLKSRADYLKHRGKTAAILDLKSFGNIMQRPIETIPGEEIGRNGYFVQPVIYDAGRRAIGALYRLHGMDIVHTVTGQEPSKTWLDAVLTATECRFSFVFVQTGGIPNIVAADFIEAQTFGKGGYSMNEYWRKGRAQFRNGVRRFRDCQAIYGDDMWVSEVRHRALTDMDFKPWALEYTSDDLPQDAAA